MERGPSFRRVLYDILKKSGLRDVYIEEILSEDNITRYYIPVFTHRSIDPVHNYEWFEFLGDSTVNKCIVTYVSKRFSRLQTMDGVKVLSRLKINLVSKKSFAQLGERLQLWDYISADEETRQTKMKQTLEDVFEAFFGATEIIIDDLYSNGSGYGICYRIIKNLLDEIDISLRYEDLFDSITRLKETFDYFKDLGQLVYEKDRTPDKVQVSAVYMVQTMPPRKILLGQGSAYKLDDAKRFAAEKALASLRARGYVRPIPEYYLTII